LDGFLITEFADKKPKRKKRKKNKRAKDILLGKKVPKTPVKEEPKKEPASHANEYEFDMIQKNIDLAWEH